MSVYRVELKHIKKLLRLRLNEGCAFKTKPPTGGRYYRVEFDGLDCRGTRRVEYTRIAAVNLREARQKVADLQSALRNQALDSEEGADRLSAARRVGRPSTALTSSDT